jgi:hypothetical protein
VKRAKLSGAVVVDGSSKIPLHQPKITRLSDGGKNCPPASLMARLEATTIPDAAKRLGHRLLDQSKPCYLSPGDRVGVSGHRSGYQGAYLILLSRQ